MAADEVGGRGAGKKYYPALAPGSIRPKGCGLCGGVAGRRGGWRFFSRALAGRVGRDIIFAKGELKGIKKAPSSAYYYLQTFSANS